MLTRSMLIVGSTFISALCMIGTVYAEEPETNYVRAHVQEMQTLTEDEYPVQQVELILLNGSNAGKTVHIENRLTDNREDLRILPEQTVVLLQIERPDGNTAYYFQETFRLPSLLWIFCGFLILTILIGKRRGLMSLIGLAVSISIITFVILPLIVTGWNAFAVSSIGAFLIACSTILISHGCNRRSILALIATCITLVCAIALAAITVRFVSLFGLGSEESVFLRLDPSLHIDPRGLLLASIIIGALGVLDDITTSQVAAIDEISKANPEYEFKKLYRSGSSVGHEHIASMINTLALAYVGTSLPMFLLFSLEKGAPVWVTINSAFLAEEIIRTLVGSSALLLATPIATFLAARSFARNKKNENDLVSTF